MSREPDALVEGLKRGDRRTLARAITLIESSRAEDVRAGQALLETIAPDIGSAWRIGITGVPGVGKSTFIDALGTRLTAADHRVAVLAVDPTSSRTGGSILGDKTRMDRLAHNPAAFVRPSPGGSAQGGVAHRTREAVLLCEAAGFDIVIVETIGVGQSEVAVADLVDTFVLLLLPGAGDELQGIKRGIMELADIVVIHKADGADVERARLAAAEYQSALQLLPRRHAEWQPPVLTASGATATGVDEVFGAIEKHRATLGTAGIAALRQEQSLLWFDATLREMLVEKFLRDEAVAAALPSIRERVRRGSLQPTAAVLELLAE